VPLPPPPPPPPRLNLNEQKVKHIRRRADMAERAGLIVEEVTPHSSSTLKEQVQQMALEW